MTDFQYGGVGDYSGEYDALSSSQTILAAQQVGPSVQVALKSYQGAFGKFNSSIGLMTGGMMQIGILNDDQKKILMNVQASMAGIYAGFLMYQSIKKLRDLKSASLLTLASAESAAYAGTIVNSWRIPVAMGAAIGVAAMFGAGYEVGKLSGMTDKNLKAQGSTDTPQARRAVIYRMGEPYGY